MRFNRVIAVAALLSAAACGGEIDLLDEDAALAGRDATASIADSGAGRDGGAQPGQDAGAQPGLDAGGQPGLDASAQPGLDAGAQPGLDAQVSTTCSADSECNGGAQGTQIVCSNASHTCITGCHSNTDCPSGTTCDTMQIPWRCVAPTPCSADSECNGGAQGTQKVCSNASYVCITGCHSNTDCPSGMSCDTSLPSWACTTATSNPIGTAITGNYDAAAAVQYAHGHWDDGVGLCAQFVSDCTISNGGLDIGYSYNVSIWYANLTAVSVPFDEYTPTTTAVRGCPGDVVLYSNDGGDNFCTATGNDQNCGHIGIVVTGGSDSTSIEAAFHNSGHDYLPLGYILGTTDLGEQVSGYSTFRIYHLVNCDFY